MAGELNMEEVASRAFQRLVAARAEHPTSPDDWMESVAPGLSEYSKDWSDSEAAFVGGLIMGMELADRGVS